MKKAAVVTALSALAQETRLDIFRYLVEVGPAGAAAGQIGEHFGLPLPTLSFHLKVLQQAGLVERTRQSRSLIYAADFVAMRALIGYLTENCCSGHPDICVTPAGAAAACQVDFNLSKEHDAFMNTDEKVFNVLFLCTGNSARSILAEALLNRFGQGRFRAYSAGSMPTGKVNPLALEILQRQNYPIDGLRSKSWDEFEQPGAPELDFVFTVCDRAAAEVCPIWPGQPMTAHWGIPDPAAVEGSEVERIQAFRDAFRILENRIKIFVSLPFRSLDKIKLQKRLDDIGQDQASSNTSA
jgi:arsenate reductase